MPSAIGGLRGDAADAWSTWQASSAVDYHYSLSISCFCPRVAGAAVTVVNGDVVSTAATPDEQRQISSVLGGPPTVEALFQTIADAQKVADQVQLTFDPDTGVPTYVGIDYSSNGSDDEVYISTSEYGTGNWSS